MSLFISNKPLQTICVSVAMSLISACASTNDFASDAMPIGAWASGENIVACDTAPITYFSSDGVIIVFLSAEGPIHSFGRWKVVNSQLSMTHNDFPLDARGISKQPVLLDIIKLSSRHFDTKNSKGEIRQRVKCDGISLNGGSDHQSH